VVTPRSGRFARRINSALDLSKMPAADDSAEQAYEKRTKDYFRPKSGWGPLNDINLSAFARFGKENLAAQLSGLATGRPPKIIGAKDKYGQSQSFLETLGPNALENLISPPPDYTRIGKTAPSGASSELNDVRNLAYFVKSLTPFMLGLDAVEYGGQGFVKYSAEMAKRYAKLPKGPSSAYQFILDKFKG
jgi:hypothetical protein